jgi:two-component system, sensor histidine kinase YesM
VEREDSWEGSGIGMANVAERLQVLYGEAAHMTIKSGADRGTTIQIQLPVLPAAGVLDGVQEERSSTLR